MRRATPPLPVSPRLLKHFAAATLALTACIALFADGSTTEAVAETVKHNQLKKTEVDMLGSRRLARQALKVREAPQPMVDDPVIDATRGEPAVWNGPTQPPAYLGAGLPAGSGSVRPEDLLPGNEAARLARKANQPKRPSPEELARLKEASRLRTGSAAVN